MDLYESIANVGKRFMLLDQYERLENISTHLLLGAFIAAIFCLAHYFYLLFIRQTLKAYLRKGKPPINIYFPPLFPTYPVIVIFGYI